MTLLLKNTFMIISNSYFSFVCRSDDIYIENHLIEVYRGHIYIYGTVVVTFKKSFKIP
jgi:hypothetical protein